MDGAEWKLSVSEASVCKEAVDGDGEGEGYAEPSLSAAVSVRGVVGVGEVCARVGRLEVFRMGVVGCESDDRPYFHRIGFEVV